MDSPLPVAGPRPHPTPVRALLLLLLASVLFGLMAFVTKRATLRLPGAQVAFLRFFVGLVAVLGAGATAIRLRPVNLRGLVVRGVLGGLAVLLFFTSLAHLPVGTATLLVYTAPVFTAVDAAIFLGERVTRAAAVGLLLTLLGVLLVVEGGAAPGRLGFGRWELCGLFAALLSGAAVTAVRAATRTDGPWEIFGAFCLFGALATAPFALAGWVVPAPREWGLLLAVGAISVVAQVLFTAGLREIRAATSGVISQVTPVTALVLGAALDHDPLGALALGGSLLTVGGVALAAWAAAEDAVRA